MLRDCFQLIRRHSPSEEVGAADVASVVVTGIEPKLGFPKVIPKTIGFNTQFKV